MDRAPNPIDPTPTPAAIDQRLVDLEMKASYTDDTLDRLNEVVVRQQRQIDLLIRELADIQRQAGDSGEMPRSLRDELPPHY